MLCRKTIKIKLHSRISTFLLQKWRVGEKILIIGRRRVVGRFLLRKGREGTFRNGGGGGGGGWGGGGRGGCRLRVSIE